MNYNVLTYTLYLFITLIVIVYVGRALYRNGRPFLVNVFTGDIVMADAINRILLAGYYLVNAGYTVIALKVWTPVNSFKTMLDVLGWKAGLILLSLGIMHLFNIIILISIGSKRNHSHLV